MFNAASGFLDINFTRILHIVHWRYSRLELDSYLSSTHDVLAIAQRIAYPGKLLVRQARHCLAFSQSMYALFCFPYCKPSISKLHCMEQNRLQHSSPLPTIQIRNMSIRFLG
jgi:hypothetical protein